MADHGYYEELIMAAVDGELSQAEEAALRAHLEEMTEAERQVCLPAYYIQKNLRPDSDLKVLIWHGDADITVPSSQSVNLFGELLSAIGEDRVEFSYIPNAKHGAERMYTDDQLGELKKYLDQALEG